MKTFALILAFLLGFGAFGAVAQPASAHMLGSHMLRMHPHMRFHPGFFFGPPIFFYDYPAYSYAGSCYWLHVRAERTGSRYWWNRWQNCRIEHGFY